jgi:hypothetical protein
LDIIWGHEDRLCWWPDACRAPCTIKIKPLQLLPWKLCTCGCLYTVISEFSESIYSNWTYCGFHSEILHGSILQEREVICQWDWRIFQTSCWRFRCMQSNSLVDGSMSSVPKLV